MNHVLDVHNFYESLKKNNTPLNTTSLQDKNWFKSNLDIVKNPDSYKDCKISYMLELTNIL
jgi:hypothetical protein